MKKMFALLLTLAMVLSLAACGAKEEEAPKAEDPAPEVEEPAAENENPYNTMTPGVLTVATSPDYAPYEFYAIGADGKADLAGFDIALIRYIADYLQLELEIVPMDFDGVLLELANGSVDLGIAGISPDPERANSMDFSDIYYEGGQAFITVKDKADMFSDLASLNNPDVSVGAQNGTIQMDLAQEYSPDADLVTLTKATDIIAELISGKLDGGYVEWDVAAAYQVNYPDLHIVCEVPYEVEGNAVGVVKGNEALLAGVNEAIAACIEDGSFSQFVAEALEQASGEIYEGLIEE